MKGVLFFLQLAIAGLVVGGLARLLIPGPARIGMFGTILAGLAGAFLGGLVTRLVFGTAPWWVGFALSVAGAVLFILPYRMVWLQPTLVDRRTARRGRGGGLLGGGKPGHERTPGLGRRHGVWNRRGRGL